LNLGTEISYQTQAEAYEIFLHNLLQIFPWTRSDGPFTHFLTLFSFTSLCPAEVNIKYPFNKSDCGFMNTLCRILK
jgi:hypothetical protein